MSENLLWEQGDGTTHCLDAPGWNPDSLTYLERCQLEAKLMALAAIVDPGPYEQYVRDKQRTISIPLETGD